MDFWVLGWMPKTETLMSKCNSKPLTFFYWHVMCVEAFQRSGHACTVCESTPLVWRAFFKFTWASSCADSSMKQLVPSALRRGSRRSAFWNIKSMSPQHAGRHGFNHHSKPIGTSLQCRNWFGLCTSMQTLENWLCQALSMTTQHLYWTFKALVNAISIFNHISGTRIFHPFHHRRVRPRGRLERPFFHVPAMTTSHIPVQHIQTFYIYKQIWNTGCNHVASCNISNIIAHLFSRFSAS